MTYASFCILRPVLQYSLPGKIAFPTLQIRGLGLRETHHGPSFQRDERQNQGFVSAGSPAVRRPGLHAVSWDFSLSVYSIFTCGYFLY